MTAPGLRDLMYCSEPGKQSNMLEILVRVEICSDLGHHHNTVEGKGASYRIAPDLADSCTLQGPPLWVLSQRSAWKQCGTGPFVRSTQLLNASPVSL